MERCTSRSRCRTTTYVEIEPPQPPAGVYIHFAKEDDTLSTIVQARYGQLEFTMHRRLLAIMLRFQAEIGSASPLASSPARVTVNTKLRAHTPVALPQLYVSAAGDTPIKISYRFGVPLQPLLDLNNLVQPGHEKNGGVALPEQTLIVLPKSLPDSCAARAPIQPMAGPGPVMPPPPAYTPALRVGDSVWIAAKLPGEEEEELRPAVVKCVDEDGGVFDAGDVAGDAGWTEHGLQMSSEGRDWVRACAAPSVFKSGGSGALVPPYCERRTIAGQGERDEVRPRPAPPAAEWLVGLKPNEIVEVLWDGAWHGGKIIEEEENGMFRVDCSEDDEEIDGLFHGWQLRPPIAHSFGTRPGTKPPKRQRSAAAGPSAPSGRRQRPPAEGPEQPPGDDIGNPIVLSDDELLAEAPAAEEEDEEVMEDADEMDVEHEQVEEAEGKAEALQADDLFSSDEDEDQDDEEGADEEVENESNKEGDHDEEETRELYDVDEQEEEDEVDLESQPPCERERIELSNVHIEIYSEYALDPVTGQSMPIESMPVLEKKQAKELLKTHFCRPGSTPTSRAGASYNAKLIECMLERKLPQSERAEFPQNLNASNARSINSTQCDELSQLCVGIARCDGDVIGVACFSLVPERRRCPCCAAEILLFRVGHPSRSVERQGVGGKLFAEMLEWISKLEQPVATIAVLSAEAARAEDNWWIRRLEKRGIKWDAATSQRELVKAVAPSGASLPKAFWLPWPMEGDDERKGDEIVALVVSREDLQQTLRQEERQRLQQTPTRPLRVLELGAYSGKLTLEFLEYGSDAIAIERDMSVPVFANFTAKGKSEHVRHIDIGQLTSLKGYDYVHISLNCVSNTQMAQSVHRRNEENEFDGESPEAEEFNRLVQHVMDLLAAAKLENPAFAFTFEQPKSVARHQLDIRRRFDTPSSNSARPIHSCLKRSTPALTLAHPPRRSQTCLLSSCVSCVQFIASVARSVGVSSAAK